MRILLAPDSFKGSLSADAFCRIATDVLERELPGVTVIPRPMADGGDGTAEVLVNALGGTWRSMRVLDPLGRGTDGRYGVLEDGTAVIDLATASGLAHLSHEERDPLRTATVGTGQLMLHAIGSRCPEVILGLGGSATVDGGMGALSALGFRFRDGDGQLVEPCGGNLIQVESVDTEGVPEMVRQARTRLACDVRNPLLGPQGAAAVFGPQKGAGAEAVEALETGLRNWSRLLESSIRETPGAGAAGGAAGGLAGLLGAEIVRGVDLVADAIGLDAALEGADWVLTGEGSYDRQSNLGKVVGEVVHRAGRLGVPAAVIAGKASVTGTEDQLLTLVADDVSEQQAQEGAEGILARRVREWAARIRP